MWDYAARRAAHDGAAGEPGPVVAEPSPPLPAQDGVRGDDDQRLLPASLHSLDSATQKSRSPRRSLGRADRPPVHGELLAQGEVLESELAMAAARGTGRVEAGGAAC